jgi:prepilin-type processing-associated H-X9-DG protein
MYSTDNGGKLTPNGSEASQPSSPTDPNGKPGGRLAQWCPGRQDSDINQLAPANLAPNAPNIGIEWIQDGLIYPYVKNVQAYRCPADESFNVMGTNVYPHVRSVSMNGWINPADNSGWTAGALDGSMRLFEKESDLTVPGPANTFLLMDENPQRINDGWMIEDPSFPSIAKPTWVDCPASYHNGAAGISFCDGHAGLKRWRDPVVLSVTGMNDTQGWSGGASKYEPDVLWLVNRSTALKSTTAFLGPQGW